MEEIKKEVLPNPNTPDHIVSNQNETTRKNIAQYLSKIKKAFIWQTLSIVVAITCVFMGNYLTGKRESQIEKKLGDSILISMRQDFETSIKELDTVIINETNVIQYSYQLYKAFANPSKYATDNMLVTYITKGGMSYYRAKINFSSYETFVNYGNVNIVKDISLLHELSSLYTYVNHAWEDGEYSLALLLEFNKECSAYLPELTVLEPQKNKGIAPAIPDSIRIRVTTFPIGKNPSIYETLSFLSNKKAQGFLMSKTTLEVNYLNYIYEVRNRLKKAKNEIDNYINPPKNR